MAAKSINIQDVFLNQARKENIPITVHLVNGFQIKGTVRGFDNFTVIVDGGMGKQQMIYKHAISTITPAKPIQMTFEPQQQQPAPAVPATPAVTN